MIAATTSLKSTLIFLHQYVDVFQTFTLQPNDKQCPLRPLSCVNCRALQTHFAISFVYLRRYEMRLCRDFMESSLTHNLNTNCTAMSSSCATYHSRHTFSSRLFTILVIAPDSPSIILQTASVETSIMLDSKLSLGKPV